MKSAIRNPQSAIGLFPRLVGADFRIAAVNQMDAGQLRLVLKANVQRSVRSCAAARLQRLGGTAAQSQNESTNNEQPTPHQ